MIAEDFDALLRAAHSVGQDNDGTTEKRAPGDVTTRQ